MNIRRTKHGLWFLAIIFSGGGVAVLMMGLWLSYDQPAPYALSRSSDRLPKTAWQAAIPTLEEFKGVWNIDLRRSLIDPPSEPLPATVTEQKIKKPARPNLRLIGYAVESDHSLAILMGPDGTVEFKAVGEELGGVTVQSITSGGVMLDHSGDEYLLKFDDESQPSPAVPYNSRRVNRSGHEVGRYR